MGKYEQAVGHGYLRETKVLDQIPVLRLGYEFHKKQ
jgi:hypothetical protein